MIEVLEINKDNLSTEVFLSMVSNVSEVFNNFLKNEEITLDSTTKILQQITECYSVYNNIKQENITVTVEQSLLNLDSMVLNINNLLESLENKEKSLNDLINTITFSLSNGDFRGEKGDQGEQGIQGIQGLQGEKGLDGTVTFEDLTPEQKLSLKGEKGDQGEQGIQGIQGLQGEKGLDGIMTFQDLTLEEKLSLKGDKGDQGEQGIQGIQGLQGIQGEKGDQGEQGIQGLQGEKGDNGTFEGLLKTINNVELFGNGNIELINIDDIALNDNGYFVLNNGLIFQWGNVVIDSSSVNGLFPIVFPNSCLNFVVCALDASDTGGVDMAPVTRSYSNAGFSVSNSTVQDSLHYFSIGF